MGNGTGRTPRAAAIGRAAEDHALRELDAAGLRCVARNFRCRLGELDLVMVDGDTLVCVEVRARTVSRFGSACESVNGAKKRRLQAAAGVFLATHPALARLPLRFDLFAIDRLPGDATPRTAWIRGIFG